MVRCHRVYATTFIDMSLLQLLYLMVLVLKTDREWLRPPSRQSHDLRYARRRKEIAAITQLSSKRGRRKSIGTRHFIPISATESASWSSRETDEGHAGGVGTWRGSKELDTGRPHVKCPPECQFPVSFFNVLLQWL